MNLARKQQIKALRDRIASLENEINAIEREAHKHYAKVRARYHRRHCWRVMNAPPKTPKRFVQEAEVT